MRWTLIIKNKDSANSFVGAYLQIDAENCFMSPSQNPVEWMHDVMNSISEIKKKNLAFFKKM